MNVLRLPDSCRRLLGTPPLLALALAMLLLPQAASAQLSSATNSTTGATCTGANNGDGFCGNSVAFSTANNGTTFTSRYAWNINADVGVASTHDTSGTAKHNVSFTATAPGGYRLQIGTTRAGAMGRRSDVSGCDEIGRASCRERV